MFLSRRSRNRLTYPTAYARSGQVWTRYRKLPMMRRYIIASTSSVVLSRINLSLSSIGVATALQSAMPCDPKSSALLQSVRVRHPMMDGLLIPPSGSAVGRTSPGSGGSNGSGGSDQRIVREVGVGPVNWPLLTKTNYTEWELIMKIKLQTRYL
jgi:hypothetical protein